ncbi:diaminopimelate decarboxylase [Ornithinibacillus sp. 4-3]|uniref:Diaminopimelate decarboxylase n=1 Tax=Ornithinibacillus sp. 4-3 TaxID=3231488 RepID=A0AB39HL51_9BACI
MNYHHSFSTNDQGNLVIGDVDTTELAKIYGTPLYVYDVSIIRENCRAFVNTFKQLGVEAQVAYASKAFSSVAIVQIMKQEGLSLDVVSEGELYTALKADFPTNKIHLHGNNKNIAELEMAVENDIGCIVIDNFHEITLLENILKEHDKQMDVLIRVTPGVESKTHHYIMTGNEDSKFGFSLNNGQADQAFELLHNHSHIRFKGLHCHIGSQIFETDGFTKAIEVLFEKIATWKKDSGFVPEVMNFGGGFGIRYTESDKPLPYTVYVEKIVEATQTHAKEIDIPLPEIWIEPGRSIVGNAGITLYSIGSTKEIPGIRKYVAIDGGMTDNLRPALYNAKYDAVVANKANQPNSETVSIAGKCCESGDMLIWDLEVPEIDSDDILAVFSTGAYGYAMASHYNRLANAAVVFVENGQHKEVIRRETYEDVVKNDLSYE